LFTKEFKRKKIVSQFQDYFSPIMGVLSCNETETLCRKNNLSFVELLQPFSKLMADVTVKDPEGINQSVANLNLLFQVRKSINQLIAEPI
jgi:hypothetical protein